jgi:cytochrome P450
MSTKRLPPGPKARLLSGHLREFMGDRLNFLARCARDHGDISSIRLGPRRCVLVNHPDLIEQVLVTDARHYVKHFGARLYRPLLGNGLVTSEGDFWLRQRRLAQPAFHRQRVAGYAPTMVAITERHLAGWAPGQVRDVHEELVLVTGAIALKTLFDLDDAGDRDAFDEAHHGMLAAIQNRLGWALPVPDWLPTPGNLRIRRAEKHLHGVIDGFIRQGRSRKEPGTDLLSMLLNAQDEDGSRMTDRQLRDETMTLYLAGHETTALTLSWAWYLLAQHPEAEEKLAAEWRAVLGGRSPTAADVPNLPYTEQVVAEAMRLYPPAYVIGREATVPVELGGYRLPRGTTVFLSQWVTHRDGRFFEEPERFRPERWAGGLAKRLPKYAYFPFGGGPRVCIGNGFALLEAPLLLATVGQRYRFTIDPNHPVELWPSITLRPRHGIRTTLAAR